MLYADDSAIDFTSRGRLERMMLVNMLAGRLGLLVSESKTEIMRIFAKGMKECSFTVDVAGMVFNREEEILCTSGVNICEDGSIEGEINHRVQQAHDCFRCNS